MLYVVSYDIPENKRRARVAKLLNGMGQRVLESVFECDLEPKAYARLFQWLQRRLKPEEGDRMRIYRLCPMCTAHVTILGAGPPVEDSPDVYIV